MLLVRYRKCEILIFYTFSDDRLSSNNETCISVLDSGEDFLLLAGFQVTAEPCDVHAERCGQRRELLVMLTRQHKRRSHHRCLIPVLGHDHHHTESHNALSTAYISLDKRIDAMSVCSKLYHAFYGIHLVLRERVGK